MCNNIKTCMNTINGQMHVYKSKVLTDKFLGSFFVVVVVGQTHAAYSVNLLIIAPLWKSGAILDSPCPSVVPWFRDSVVPWFRDSVIP